jgi:RNA polymerase sigma factor (sigma-70 family)
MLYTDNANLKNEKALIKGCIEGNRIYQNQLYKIFAAQMMGVCMRYAKTKEDAEDILQEGFIQAFTHIKQFRFIGTIDAWMRKIFINCALQKLREKENNYLFIEIDNVPEINTSYTVTEEVDMKLLIKYIQSLPVISRLVFNLYVFEGYKHKEIAKMLKISEGTSKSNLFDARNNLRKQLKNYNLFFFETVANG